MTAQIALTLQGAMLSARSLEDATHALVQELAAACSCRRVSLALDVEGQLRLQAVSDGTRASDPSEINARLLAALGETFDQRAALCWPPQAGPASALPRITLAHRSLASGQASVAGMPLVAQGRLIGALCLERDPQAGFDEPALATLEHLACLAAPVLALMQANERAWHRRVADQLRAWLDAEDQPSRRFQRRAMPVLAAVAALLLLFPVDLSIGGRARLEGGVQRVLAAPADGFVQQVHARPGETVRAGQPLVDLAEQDLMLERQRWQSQLAQQLDGLVAAQARADRAQLAQHQGKADEAQAQLELVEQKLSRSRVVAPFDGVVVQGDLSQQLGAPVKLGAELMTVAPNDSYRVIVEVDERDVARIQLGQSGTLALTALPWNTLPLSVKRITPVAVAVEGRNVFEVEAELLQRPAGLRPGLQGNAQIVAGRTNTLWQWSRRVVETLRLGIWAWFG
jgi:Barrel-sandwich domain of CusB or HlyD membrane-fusion/GAF domain